MQGRERKRTSPAEMGEDERLLICASQAATCSTLRGSRRALAKGAQDSQTEPLGLDFKRSVGRKQKTGRPNDQVPKCYCKMGFVVIILANVMLALASQANASNRFLSSSLSPAKLQQTPASSSSQQQIGGTGK